MQEQVEARKQKAANLKEKRKAKELQRKEGTQEAQ